MLECSSLVSLFSLVLFTSKVRYIGTNIIVDWKGYKSSFVNIIIIYNKLEFLPLASFSA